MNQDHLQAPIDPPHSLVEQDILDYENALLYWREQERRLIEDRPQCDANARELDRARACIRHLEGGLALLRKDGRDHEPKEQTDGR